MKQYKYIPNTKYIVLDDGNVARLMKPTKIHRQTYYNFQIEGKYKRWNAITLKEFLEKDKSHPNEQVCNDPQE